MVGKIEIKLQYLLLESRLFVRERGAHLEQNEELNKKTCNTLFIHNTVTRQQKIPLPHTSSCNKKCHIMKTRTKFAQKLRVVVDTSEHEPVVLLRDEPAVCAQ